MAEPGQGRDTAGMAAGEGIDPSTMLLERLAHDLRGPLSPLQTAAYLLRRPDVDAERQDELLGIIDRQTTRLSAMVQEVSDWMRARQSRLIGHREPAVLPMLAELACTPSGPGVRLEVSAALELATIDGDAQRLVQMLSTLAEFMQARVGGAGTTVRMEPVETGVRIDVEVSGPGWKDGEREELFSAAEAVPFDEGLGMRLLIAQAIARAHGGEMLARDTPEGAAMIRVLLPFGAAGSER